MNFKNVYLAVFSLWIVKSMGQPKEEIVWNFMLAGPRQLLQPVLLQCCVHRLCCACNRCWAALCCFILPVYLCQCRVWKMTIPLLASLYQKRLLQGTWLLLLYSCICHLSRRGVSDISTCVEKPLWGVCCASAQGAFKAALWWVHCGGLWFPWVGLLQVTEEVVGISLPKHLENSWVDCFLS